MSHNYSLLLPLEILIVCLCVSNFARANSRTIERQAPAIVVGLDNLDIKIIRSSGKETLLPFKGESVSSLGYRIAFWKKGKDGWKLYITRDNISHAKAVWSMPHGVAVLMDGAPNPVTWSPDGGYVAFCIPIGSLFVKPVIEMNRVYPHMGNAKTEVSVGLVRLDLKTGIAALWIDADEDVASLGAANFQSVAWTSIGLFAVRSANLWWIRPDPDAKWSENNIGWNWECVLIQSSTGTMAGQGGDQWQFGETMVSSAVKGNLVALSLGRLNKSSGDEKVLIYRFNPSKYTLQCIGKVPNPRNLNSSDIPRQLSGVISDDGKYLATIDNNDRAWLWILTPKPVKIRLLATHVDSITILHN